MKIGPKYKIARRLGAPIFEKTQTQKYTLSLARKEKAGKMPTWPKSEFGVQLIEKQKVRFTYGLGERQFRLYVNKALASDNPIQKLYELLESRLDNVIYRAGFAKTRAQARQITSHGLILVSGRRVTVPSIILKSGDKLSIRPGSTSSTLWTLADERVKEATIPAWLKVVASERVIEVIGRPVYEPSENLFNLGVVIEFYNR